MAWKDVPGPAGLLRPCEQSSMPDVGLFNLCWLMLDQPDFSRNRRPEDSEAMNLAIYKLQHLKIPKGRLGELAALNSLLNFYLIVQSSPDFPFKQQLVSSCCKKLNYHEPIRSKG
jgi:hypothetical protein